MRAKNWPQVKLKRALLNRKLELDEEHFQLLADYITLNHSQIVLNLQSLGWHTWYDYDYWVNRKCVQNPAIQDYTNYGMNLEEAFLYETFSGTAFPPKPLSGLFGSGATGP